MKKTATLMATLALTAGLTAACGGNGDGGGSKPAADKSYQRTSISEAAWCKAGRAWRKTSPDDDFETATAAATKKFIALGVPKKMDDQSIAGLKVVAKLVAAKKDGADPLSTLSADDQQSFFALYAYTGNGDLPNEVCSELLGQPGATKG